MTLNDNDKEKELNKDEAFLSDCMYFTANRLSRAITRIADEAFATTGLAPAYGYVIRLVMASPGIMQKDLSEKLCIAPSTLTRFVDKLEVKQLVTRQVQGKTVRVYPTDKAKELLPVLLEASRNLKNKYDQVLGEEFATLLNSDILAASQQLD